MMNSVKRLLSLLFIFTLVLFLFPGCNGEKDDRDFGDEELIKSRDQTVLTFYVNSLSESYKEVVSQLELKLSKTLNVKLEFVKLDDIPGRIDKIEEIINSGKPCDVICVNISWEHYSSIYRVMQLAQKGLLMDLTELLPKYAPTVYSFYSEEELKEVSYKGAIVAIPAYLPLSRRPCVLIARELAERYNIREIKDFDDYEAFLRKVSGKEPGYDLWTGWTTEDFIDYYGYVNVGGYLVYRKDDPEMKLVPWEQTAEFLMANETIKRWTELMEKNQDPSADKIASVPDRIASLPLYIYTHSPLLSFGEVKEWNVYPLYMDRESRRVPMTMNVLVISRNSRNAEVALQFLEQVYSDQELYDLLVHGIEGRDYEIRDGKLYRLSTAQYYVNKAFWNLNLERDDGNAPDNYKKAYMESATSNTDYSPHGPLVLPEDITDRLYERESDFLSRFYDTFRGRIIDSRELNESLSMFIEMQQEKGVDELLERVQRELDKLRMGIDG